MRKTAWLIFYFLFFILLLPNYSLFERKGLSGAFVSIFDSPFLFFLDCAEALALADPFLFVVLSQILLFAALGTGFRWLLVNFIFFLVLPFELFYMREYGSPSSAHILSIISETNWDEVVGYLGSGWVWLVGYFLWVILLAFCLCIFSKVDIRWRHRSRAWVLMVFAPFLFVNFYSYRVGDKERQATSDLYAMEFDSYQFSYGLGGYSNTYPYGLFVRAFDYFYQLKSLERHAAALHDFPGDHVRIESVSDSSENYVLVIGESSRADHWGIDGFLRNTTPRLEELNNLVFFNDAVSVTAATRTSVPTMLSKTSVGDIAKGNFKESWISDYKKAGFKVYWLSMQMPVGVHDTTIGIYASLTDHVEYLNLGNYTNQSEVDGKLLAALSRVLQDGQSKRLIVLHTLGSHAPYQRRYPKDFEVYSPVPPRDEIPNIFDSSQKDSISNSYDNSVLYTDYFLSEVVGRLDSLPGLAFMWYASDHGQSLFDPGCSMAGHGFFSKYNFHVPVLFWYSHAYELARPEEVAAIKYNSMRPVYMGDFYQTFLQSAGFKLTETEASKSFAGSRYQLAGRPVTIDGGQIMDYDKDLLNASCKR